MEFHPHAREAWLRLIDGDEVEPHNLERQVFRTYGINKAEAMGEEIEHHSLVIHPEYIQGAEDLHPYLWEDMREQRTEDEPAMSVWILAVDNDATRKVIYDAINEFPLLNVVTIDPGNEHYTGNVMMWMRLAGFEPFCHPQQRYSQLVTPTDRMPGGGCSKEVASAPQLITANKMAATISLHMLMALLNDQTLNEEVQFDLRQFKVTPIGEWIIREESE